MSDETFLGQLGFFRVGNQSLPNVNLWTIEAIDVRPLQRYSQDLSFDGVGHKCSTTEYNPPSPNIALSWSRNPGVCSTVGSPLLSISLTVRRLAVTLLTQLLQEEGVKLFRGSIARDASDK